MPTSDSASSPGAFEVRALLVILALAAALRLAGLDLLPGFSGDEGYEAFYGWQSAEHRVFQMNPVRPYLGPWFLWLMAPFVSFGVTPFLARLPVALLGVAAVGLAWAVGRRLGGRAAGLGSALLMATAPFAVLFSRLSLSVATTPFWALLTCLLLLRLIDAPRWPRGLAMGAALGAAVSFHPQGLLLGPVAVALVLIIPAGKDLLRAPAALVAVVAGFCLVAWPVWVMILDQVGLGPGIDYSGTWVGQKVSYTVAERLARSPGQLLDGFAGGRMLHWVAGPSSMNPPGERLVWGLIAVGAIGGAARLVRAPTRHAIAWAVATILAIGLTVLRSADFDLGGLTRERYLLTGLTLSVPMLAWGLLGEPTGSDRRERLVAGGLLGAIASSHLLFLVWGFFGPMIRTGGDPEPSFRAGTPDVKVQAVDWMLDRIGEDDGLLLAGDGWSYWPFVALTGEAFPADFVPQDPEACAAILRRTTHRRRWLVDYAGWHWTATIERCLAASGHGGMPPAFVGVDNSGRPVLTVWELPPETHAP